MIKDGLYVDKSGNKHRYFNGEFHCTDGPAIEYADGTKVWCQHGTVHRTDGPAVERTDGTSFWYINGKELTKDQLSSQSFMEFIKLIG